MLVRQLLSTARRLNTTAELAKISYLGLSEAQKTALKSHGCKIYSGKVRDVIFHTNSAVLLHTDRLSAFDCFVGYIPFRGQILAMLSKWWADKLADSGIPVARMELLHPRAIRSIALEPVRVEVIVRGYLAGNLMKEYNAGSRNYCGNQLPEGLSGYGKLPSPIITPTTKAAAYQHDEPITASEIVSQGLCTEQEWMQISSYALAAFKIGAQVYGSAGWLMVDTKYEFGRDASGQIMIMDEIHTPDSSRLWEAESYSSRLAEQLPPVMLDKEIVRRWLNENGFNGSGRPPEIPGEIVVKLATAYLNVAEVLLNEQIGASLSAPDPVGFISN
jgi:phosphoribosylaminoimidazole-succinocarboxamide synthase